MQIMHEFAREIWRDNYKAPGEQTIEETWKRLATACASVEPQEAKAKVMQDFYNALQDFKFVPGGRIMANLGIDGREATTLFNCFVHMPGDMGMKDPDSLTGIFDLLAAQAQTLKSEGGYGTNFSYLRPAGAYVKGIANRTPGVLKFMELWDKSSEIITSGSNKLLGGKRFEEKDKIRKGAQMAVLSVWHPEIRDFIKAKQTKNRFTKFNMSVGIVPGFMEAVLNNETWDLVFPDTEFDKYKTEWDGNLGAWLDKGYPVIKYETVMAAELWDELMYCTYTRNEPGVLFLDLFNKLNPLAYAEVILATNPCGEIGMALGVCDLGSLNLTQFIKTENGKPAFNFEEYAKIITVSVRFLDNINDISRTPTPEYKEAIINKRRIGLGNMGLGSLHLMLGIRFGSKESLELIQNIYRVKAESELLASAELGKEKGSFPLFDSEKYFNTYWWNTLPINEEVKSRIKQLGTMRNSHRSMNAPTGNTGIYANLVSGGIEPVFALEYDRWAIVNEKEQIKLKEDGLHFPVVSTGEWFDTEHFKFDTRGDEIILKGSFNGIDYEIDKNRGLVKRTRIEDYGWKFAKDFYSKEELERLTNEGVFATTHDLSVMDHVNTLSIAAKFTDMNNSKTTNVPADYPYEDFKKLYIEAWKSGIKGITTYREGTMTAVLEKATEEKTSENRSELERQFKEAGNSIISNVLKLPDEYYSKGFILRDSKKKKWYLNIAFADKEYKRPFALFVHTNNHEGNEVTDDFIAKMENLLTDKGISKELVEAQKVKYIGQKNTTKIARIIGMALRHNIAIHEIVQVMEKFDVEISSFIFRLRKLLSSFIEDGTKVEKELCPTCKQETIVYEQKCKSCKSCGWSAC